MQNRKFLKKPIGSFNEADCAELLYAYKKKKIGKRKEYWLV